MCKSFDFREFTLRKDRSFIFNIDKLDQDETAEQVQAATALARQNRQEVIPEVDMYKTICGNGQKRWNGRFQRSDGR